MSPGKESSKKAPALSPSDTPVEVALDKATGPRRAEADELVALLEEITGEQPVVWAGRIVGFGEYEYRYDSGRSGRAPKIGFATGAKHTIYLVNGFAERWPDLLENLGAHRASTGCLYLTRLANVDRDVLRILLERSLGETRSSAT